MKPSKGILRDLRNAACLAVFSVVAFVIGVLAITYPPSQTAQPNARAERVRTHGSPPVTIDPQSMTMSSTEGAGPQSMTMSSTEGAGPQSMTMSSTEGAGPQSMTMSSTEGVGPQSQTGSSAANSALPYKTISSAPDTYPREIPVLCYHYLRESTTPLQFAKILGALFLNLPLIDEMDLWTQTAAAFEKQVKYLKDEGYESITLDDLARWRQGLATLPPKPVVITFDDGDRSVLDIAYPILERYGFKATLFVVTSKVGQEWDRVNCLGWDDLKMLETSGVFSIQSHSHDLHRKVRTEEAELPVFFACGDGDRKRRGKHPGISMVFEDLRTSKAMIEHYLGSESNYLAWPYGFGDAELDSVAAVAGFNAFCTLEAGKNKRHTITRPTAGTALWLTDLGALAPRPVFSFSWASYPTRESMRTTTARGDWTTLEIKRFTITARTSMRSFKEMLDE